MIFLGVLGWSVTVLALCAAAYTLMAAVFVRRFAHQAQESVGAAPALTVLKPLHGADADLEACLCGFFTQDYPAPFEIVFGVHGKTDPAIAVVERLCDRTPGVKVALTVNPRCHGLNAKVSNLINMRAAATSDILVISDADIAVSPDYLRKVVEALSPAEVGAVTCLYTGWAVGDLWSRFSAMGIDYQFLPNAISGLALGLAKPCFGSTIAIKRKVLEEIGGLEAFVDFLADDYEIGRAVRAKGYKVVIPAFAVHHACTEKGVSEWFAHELRWARTIRINDPLGHAGSIVTHPVPLALLGVILSGFTMFALGSLAATLGARAVLKWRLDRRFGCDSGSHWLLPVRDVLSFGVFLLSLTGGSVKWQGRRLRVERSGILLK